MGVLVGMAASGCGFLCVGLWQGWLTLASFSRSHRSFKSPPFHAAQLVFIAALAFLHIISGLVASHKEESMADGVGMAVPLERSGVALVFFIFAFASLISEKTKLLPLPREILQLMVLFAFGEEFLLFYLQRSDAGLESRYYNLLLVPIGVCLLATALGIAYPFSVLPPLARSAALVLQGTWLVQMALSFFTTAFMTKGCSLKQIGDGDYILSCAGMALMRGKAVATLQFNCHMALLLIILLPLYGISTRKDNMFSDHNDLTYERLEITEFHRDGDASDAVPPSSFALELEEGEALSDRQHDVNGFQSVAI